MVRVRVRVRVSLGAPLVEEPHLIAQPHRERVPAAAPQPGLENTRMGQPTTRKQGAHMEHGHGAASGVWVVTHRPRGNGQPTMSNIKKRTRCGLRIFCALTRCSVDSLGDSLGGEVGVEANVVVEGEARLLGLAHPRLQLRVIHGLLAHAHHLVEVEVQVKGRGRVRVRVRDMVRVRVGLGLGLGKGWG